MLRAYQQDYAQLKQALGRRKVSKAEQQLWEEQYVTKQLLVEMEGPSKAVGTTHFQCVLSSLVIQSSHRNSGIIHARLLCVHKLWIPGAL